MRDTSGICDLMDMQRKRRYCHKGREKRCVYGVRHFNYHMPVYL